MIGSVDTFAKPIPGAVFSQGNEVIIPASDVTSSGIARASAIMQQGIMLGGDINVVRPTNSLSSVFLALVLSHGKTQRALLKRAKGTSVVHLHNSDIQDVSINYPSSVEQMELGGFFRQLDSIIDLCQRKLDLLTQAKKALMQQIFSQKLRFKADDGSDFPDWEKKKLGDLFKISAGGDLKKNQSSPVKSQEFSYPVYANALVNKGFHSFANYYVITGESFTVTGRGDVGFAVPRHEQYVPIVRLLVCQPLHGENVDFFAALINQIHIFVESTGVPQLTVPQLSSLIVSVPTLPEQQKIASCLSSADALIDQARTEFEQWQEVKKSLLQQMFV